MKITYKDGKIETLNVEINGYGDQITLEKDKDLDNGKTTSIDLIFKSKSGSSQDKDIRISCARVERLMKRLSDIVNKDNIDMLEKNVYVLPFASKDMANLIDNLKNLKEFIKIS